MNRKSHPTPTVDLDRARQRLDRLGLLHAAEQVEGLISEAVKDNSAGDQVIDWLLNADLRSLFGTRDRQLTMAPALVSPCTGIGALTR